MKIYKLHVDSRKGEGYSKVFKTFGDAVAFVVDEEFGGNYNDAEAYREFDSDISLGEIYTEENTYEITECEL